MQAREQESKEMLENENNAAETRYQEYRTEMNELNRKVRESLQLLETTRQAAERERCTNILFQVITKNT